MSAAEQKANALGLYQSAAAMLGGNDTKAQSSFEAVWQSGLQPRRFFHTPAHYLAVAGADANGSATFAHDFAALRFKAGCDHDVAYVHIDRKGNAPQQEMLPELRSAIERFAELKIDEKGSVLLRYKHEALSEEQARYIQALNIIFNHPAQLEQLSLSPFSNQNETLSALFGLASGLEMGIAAKYLVAEMALIESTVPFGAPDRLPALKARLEQASALWQPPLLSADEITQTMQQAEALSNQDVGDFKKGFKSFSANSFKLLLENSAGSVSDTDAARIDPNHMATAMKNMAGFLGGIAKDSALASPMRCIFHRADESRNPDEAKAIKNIDALTAYLGEASANLQQLIDRCASAPTSMGEIFASLGVAQENAAPIPAHDFFLVLAPNAFKSFVPQSDHPAISAMRNAIDSVEARINQGGDVAA